MIKKKIFYLLIINMPPKKIKFVCSDKIPLPQGQIRNKPGVCFKKGLGAGFVAGLQKASQIALKKQVKMNIIGKENINQNNLKTNIKQYIDSKGGRPVGVKNRSDLLAELVKRENFQGMPTGLTNIKTMGKRRMIEMLEATGKYRRGGEKDK
jgi:hypothetical protein